MLRFVEPGSHGFLQHRTGWFLKGNEQPEFRLFPLHIALESGDLTPVDVAAFHLHDDALGLAAVVVKEVDVAVDAAVSALTFVPGRAGVHHSN